MLKNKIIHALKLLQCNWVVMAQWIRRMPLVWETRRCIFKALKDNYYFLVVRLAISRPRNRRRLNLSPKRVKGSV